MACGDASLANWAGLLSSEELLTKGIGTQAVRCAAPHPFVIEKLFSTHLFRHAFFHEKDVTME